MRNIDYITKTLRRPFAGAALCTLALACALSVTGCQKQGIPASKGDNVLFSAGIGGSESDTKTSYTDSNVSNRNLPENINWLTGDLIRIWSAECSEPADHYADYTVTPTDGTPNKATIAVKSGTVGLRWGEAETEHHFYAVYPSPGTTGKTDDAGTLTDASFSFTGHIPATQAVSRVTTNGNTTIASPDMANLYMVSKAQATPESDGKGIFLRFTPLSTAIQFTISRDSENEDEVLYVALESAEHELNGAFSANISGWTPAESGNYVYPDCTSENSGEIASYKKVTTNLEGQDVTVSDSKELTFTFFLLPVSGTQNVVDDLSFIISKKDSDGAVATLKTKLSMADGTGISFPTHKKTYVKGILVPDGLVTLSVTTTDYDLEDPTDPTTVGETGNYNEQGSTDPTTVGDTDDYGSEGSTDPTTGGSTGNYNEQGSTDPTTGGDTDDYGSEGSTDPTTGGSTGNYNEQGSTDPTTGGSTDDYGSEVPTDPTTGGSTGNYIVNNSINIFTE